MKKVVIVRKVLYCGEGSTVLEGPLLSRRSVMVKKVRYCPEGPSLSYFVPPPPLPVHCNEQNREL